MRHLIVDTNCFAPVFNQKSKEHEKFSIVLESIEICKFAIAWGGSKYREELMNAERYLRLILEYTRAGIAHEFPIEEIDAVHDQLEAKVNDSDFDDPHIVAIQIVSRAEIIVSNDGRSYPFLKDQSLYPKNHKRARIFNGNVKSLDMFK